MKCTHDVNVPRETRAHLLHGAIWLLYLFLLNACPLVFSVFSITGFGLFPRVSCLAPVPIKSNFLQTDPLYNLLRFRSLKNISVSQVILCKLVGDDPENYSPRPKETSAAHAMMTSEAA